MAFGRTSSCTKRLETNSRSGSSRTEKPASAFAPVPRAAAMRTPESMKVRRFLLLPVAPVEPAPALGDFLFEFDIIQHRLARRDDLSAQGRECLTECCPRFDAADYVLVQRRVVAIMNIPSGGHLIASYPDFS